MLYNNKVININMPSLALIASVEIIISYLVVSEFSMDPHSTMREAVSNVFSRSKDNNKIVYFVGIGGIGMSGIAEVLHKTGYGVGGSDKIENSSTARLRGVGIPITIGHCGSNIDGSIACLVITRAIQYADGSNPECTRALELNLPIFYRSDILGFLMVAYQNSVTISGTHGKTTTTSLVASLLTTAGFQPSVVNGGIMNEFESNIVLGPNKEWIVCEGDESDGSFKELPTSIAMVTNVETEHMEYFKSEQNLEAEFVQFLKTAKLARLVCVDCPRVRRIRPNLLDCHTYGLHESADVRAVNARYTKEGSYFDVNFHKTGKSWKNLFIPLHGEHNVQNALGLVALAEELEISESVLRETFVNFRGVQRRFTVTGVVNGITVIDDYAHHPSEIRAVLTSARNICAGKLIAIHQPHRYTRLANFFKEFANCFQKADRTLLLSVYTAGEKETLGPSSETLLTAILENGDEAVYSATFEEASQYLFKICCANDMVVFMGAGNITELANMFPQMLRNN